MDSIAREKEKPVNWQRAIYMKWIRGALLLLVGTFFLYHYLIVGSLIYFVLVAALVILALASVSNVLPGRFQNLALNIAISLIFLYFVFNQINFRVMVETLQELNYFFLLPSTLLLLLFALVRAYRWKWFFSPNQPLAYRSLLSALAIGTAANMILPARAGEFIRAFVLGRREQLSKTTAFATIVLERVFDGLTIVLFLLAVVFFMRVDNPTIHYMAMAGAAFYLGAVVILVLIYFRHALLVRWIQKLFPRQVSEKLIGILRAFAAGLESIRNGRQLLVIAILSLICWSLVAASLWPVLAAFDFGAPVPGYTPFLLVAAISLGMMIPTPAGIGAFQYACLLTLQVVFASHEPSLAANFSEQAATFSIVAHFSQVVPEIAFGLIFFIAEGLSVQEVRSNL